jgi:hypothetical protein
MVIYVLSDIHSWVWRNDDASKSGRFKAQP